MILGPGAPIRLHTDLPCDGRYIDYTFDTETGEHTLNLCCILIHSQVPGELVNHLAPYRDSRGVQKLIAWLNKADHLRSLT
ncbi:hypothetical protein SEA_CHOTABHAI_118 [Mycobacterium phage ChotaBhai]|nr:hypothetical protein SEA_CHOTABHAI_118 [Mycobacterium phage ChotaBhai]